MPTLRQKVDSFCKDSGTKVGDTDKLRNQVGMLKQELKKVKEAHKHQLHLAKAAAKTKKVKATPKDKTLKAPKAPKAPAAPKAPKAPAAPKAPKVKQEVAMQPLPAAMPQTATVATAGRRTRRHRRY